MGLSQNHKIHTASLQVQFEGMEEDFGLQERLALVFHEKVKPALEKELDELADPNTTWVIDSLVLDCGFLPSENWEEILHQKILEEIRNELESLPAGKSTVLSKKEKAREVFFFFIERGFFPWNSPFSKPLELETEAYLDRQFLGKLSHSYKKNSLIRDRLFSSFSVAFIAKIVGAIGEISNPKIPGLFKHFQQHAHRNIQKELLSAFLSYPVFQKTISDNEFLILLIAKLDGENLQILADYLGSEVTADDQFLRSLVMLFLNIPNPHVFKKMKLLTETLQKRHPGILEKAGFSAAEFESGEPFDSFLKDEKKDVGETHSKKDFGRPDEISSDSKTQKPNSEIIENLGTENEIFIENAGLVLLHPFLADLFNSVRLTENGKFFASSDQQLAARVLQFLVYGENELSENYFVFNKILCGMGVSEVLDVATELSPELKEECVALLQAVIGHWSILKNTSVDGLRETFLQRSGRISRVEKGWKLVVERKAVDVLLNKLPWGIGIVKLPWMNEMMYVEWN
ncbi:hypothetical protein GCM10009119_21720 [Algoriphagus jejuensis]|uniref:Uncharacterized protein n=1 Tax=Algoriphagus jejuensis TaxID=419934 RepID=A0ABP3YFN1_9BACT